MITSGSGTRCPFTVRCVFSIEKDVLPGGRGAKTHSSRKPFDEYLILDINHHIKLLEMVQYAMEKLADDAPIPWGDDLKDRSDKDETAANEKLEASENYLAKLLQPGGLLPNVSRGRRKPVQMYQTEQERDAALRHVKSTNTRSRNKGQFSSDRFRRG